MSNQSVTFTINLGGNAYKGVLQLDNAVEQVIGSVKNATYRKKKHTQVY